MDWMKATVYFILGLGLSIFATAGWISYSRKRGIGQEIREEGNKAHYKKSGTPTMGGLAFILVFLVLTIIYLVRSRQAFPGFRPEFFLTLLSCLGYGAIGYIDDTAKLRKKESEGLTPKQKLVLQFVLAFVLVILSFIFNPKMGDQILPFSRKIVHMGYWAVPILAFIIVGTTNAVNLTDGLDGLAAGVSIPVFLSLALLAVFGENPTGLEAGEGVMVLSVIFAGSLVGYLFFNAHPASVMMGDTGSMAIGGAICGLLLSLNQVILLIVLGGVYLAEALSVIIQTSYFKASHGKRLFRMSPLHHHFELSGFPEEKVTVAFSLVSMLFSALALFFVLH